jgi:hypothetical protein
VAVETAVPVAGGAEWWGDAEPHRLRERRGLAGFIA